MACPLLSGLWLNALKLATIKENTKQMIALNLLFAT